MKTTFRQTITVWLILCAISYQCTTKEVAPGQEGLSSLIRLDEEQPGSECEAGGTAIHSGLDLNNNGSLEDDEIESTAYVCSAQDGEDGEDGNDGEDGEDGNDGEDGSDAEPGTVSREFYIQNGYYNYGGNQSITISNSSNFIQSIQWLTIKTGSTENRGLIRFDNIKEVLDAEFKGKPYQINEAILYLRDHGNRDFNLINSESNNLCIYHVKKTESAIFDIDHASWIKANETKYWNEAGAMDSGERWAPIDAIPLEPGNYMAYLPFRINREIIREWIDDPSKNKGLVLAFMHYHNDSYAKIMGAINNSKVYRPLLYINARVKDATSQRNHTSDSIEKTEWPERSYGEKLRPLVKFLKSEGL